MATILLDIEVIEGTKVREIIDTFEKENHMQSRLAHTKAPAHKESETETTNNEG